VTNRQGILSVLIVGVLMMGARPGPRTDV
jgi:hypothetical protein